MDNCYYILNLMNMTSQYTMVANLKTLPPQPLTTTSCPKRFALQL